MKKIKKFLTNIIIIILLFILTIVFSSFIQLNIHKKEYCNIFGYSIFQIETGSMSDALEIEDIIFIKLDNENISVGDIITFKQDGVFVTHRVVEIDEEKIITKGDNNSESDKPISKNDIIGKVEIIISDVRIWKAVFSDIKVIVSLTITIILFVLLVSYKEKVGEDNV